MLVYYKYTVVHGNVCNVHYGLVAKAIACCQHVKNNLITINMFVNRLYWRRHALSLCSLTYTTTHTILIVTAEIAILAKSVVLFQYYTAQQFTSARSPSRLRQRSV